MKTYSPKYFINEDGSCDIDPDEDSSVFCSDIEDCAKINSVQIGKHVTDIKYGTFFNCTCLSRFTVEEENKDYSSSDDGVLFNKAKTILVRYPSGIQNSSYEIPNSVISIENLAFVGCYRLECIVFSDSIVYIGDRVFFQTNLKDILVSKSNKNFSSINGVLFNKDATKLIYYPTQKSEKSYIIPGTVNYICKNSFEYCDVLNNIEIPQSVEHIDQCAINHCKNLANIYYGGTKDDWGKVMVECGNEGLNKATIHCKDGDIE